MTSATSPVPAGQPQPVPATEPASTSAAPPAAAGLESTSSSQAHVAAPDRYPSFIKGLFLGELRESLVFPFPSLSAEEGEALHMTLTTFRQFAADHIDAAKHDREGRFEPELLDAFHELGFMGVNIPEAYGGFNASAKVFTRIFGEIGATDPALAVYFGAHQSIGCKGITLFGTDAQKERYLPKCATGELVAAFCLTEPGSGSDAQAMTTTATLSEDGTHYILNGAKMWISNAGYAGVFTVFARMGEDRGVADRGRGANASSGQASDTQGSGTRKPRITAFIVDANTPGIRLGKIEEKMGIKASDTRAVFFENVRVPVENVLGDVGHGFRIALEILNSGRLGLAAASSIAAQRIMRQALAYASERKQFGKPIVSFELLREKIALAAADCYASDAAARLTAGMMDRGAIDYSLETAACKIFASEVAYRTTNDAMQMAGGVGYSKEYPYERAVRDSRINLIFEGTNEILRVLIALTGLQDPSDRLLGVQHALHDPMHGIGEIGAYAVNRITRSLHHPEFMSVHPSFAREAKDVGELIHMFSVNAEAALRRHGKGIMEREIVQARMADAAIDIYHSVAVLSRVTFVLGARRDPATTKAEVDCARLFLHTAQRRAAWRIRAILRDDSELQRPVVDRAVETLDVTPKIDGE